MSLSSQHHSFDIAIAAMFGVECAILIHHFQHWIRINRSCNRNVHEGRCWTYQTRKSIRAHFPYWKEDEVRRLTDKLVEQGVLIKGNHNKSQMDRTIWYAFSNEKAFQVDEEFIGSIYKNSNNFCDLAKVPNGLAKVPNAIGKSATAIPDTKAKDSKTTDKKKEEKAASPPPSAKASELCKFFIEKIKEINPKFKDPNLGKWEKEFDCIIDRDKRDAHDLYAMITWVFSNPFWRTTCLSPSNLRKHYDRIYMQMQEDQVKKIAEENREYVQKTLKEFPDRLKSLTINSKYAMNLSAGKEVPFSLPQESFRRAFISMFGGVYEPSRFKEQRDSMERNGI